MLHDVTFLPYAQGINLITGKKKKKKKRIQFRLKKSFFDINFQPEPAFLPHPPSPPIRSGMRLMTLDAAGVRNGLVMARWMARRTPLAPGPLPRGLSRKVNNPLFFSLSHWGAGNDYC